MLSKGNVHYLLYTVAYLGMNLGIKLKWKARLTKELNIEY